MLVASIMVGSRGDLSEELMEPRDERSAAEEPGKNVPEGRKSKCQSLSQAPETPSRPDYAFFSETN